MSRILNAIVYPSLIPGPHPESLTRNKCRLMEALYGVVPYKAGPAFVRDAEDAIHKRGGYRLASLSEVAPPADEF